MQKILVILFLLSFDTTYGQINDLPKGSIGYFLTKAVDMSRDKKYEEGLVFIDSAFRVDSDNENIFALKAEILWMMKRFSEAAENYQKALLLDKDSSYLFGAYLFLGVLYEKANMPTQARLQYLKAVYFFENKKKKSDKFFADVNKIDYALALKLSGNNGAWDKLLDDPFYKKRLDIYIGKTREEILEIYFQPFSGG
jgi:tetratricopeptide (TPR) repeat protein